MNRKILSAALLAALPVVLTAGMRHTGNETNRLLPGSGAIQPSDIQYLGSFAIPTVRGDPDENGWSYGGRFMAYSTEDDGVDDSFPGSLWISTRHDEGAKTGGGLGQFSIPAPSTDPNWTNWPRATLMTDVQQFGQDYIAAEGERPFMDDGLWYKGAFGPGYLFASTYEYYNANTDDKPHIFWCTDTFDSVSAQQHVGPYSGLAADQVWKDSFHSMKSGGYAFKVPNGWHRNAAGEADGYVIAIGQGNREGGHLTVDECVEIPYQIDGAGRKGCQMGPGFSLVHPDTLFNYDEFHNGAREIPAILCASYPQDTVHVDGTFPYTFADKDQWVSMAYIANYDFDIIGRPISQTAYDNYREAVVALVMDCEGSSHYNNSASCYYGHDCCGSLPNTGYICGEQGDPYPCWSPELWLFRPADYEAVWAGADSSGPAPYAMRDLSPYSYASRNNLICGSGDGFGLHFMSMTYDVHDHLLFIAERGHNNPGGSSYPPFVHVFRIN